MSVKKFKSLSGGYVTMPMSIMACKKLNIYDKVFFCYVMGLWMNNGDVFLNVGKTAFKFNIENSAIAKIVSKLSDIGIVKVIENRKTCTGEEVFKLAIDESAVNLFFGVELFSDSVDIGKKAKEETKPTKVRNSDPINWLHDEYYNYEVETCRR